jgi:hypothetical protein
VRGRANSWLLLGENPDNWVAAAVEGCRARPGTKYLEAGRYKNKASGLLVSRSLIPTLRHAQRQSKLLGPSIILAIGSPDRLQKAQRSGTCHSNKAQPAIASPAPSPSRTVLYSRLARPPSVADFLNPLLSSCLSAVNLQIPRLLSRPSRL